MKKVFMLFVALCLTGVVKAQISSSSKVYAYAPAGKDVKYANIQLIVFDYNCIHSLGKNWAEIRKMYKKTLHSYLFQNRSWRIQSIRLFWTL